MANYQRRFITTSELPIVWECVNGTMKKEEFWNLIKVESDQIQKDLISYGGILFRGFPMENVDDFSLAIKSLGLGESVDYIGGDSPRIKIKEGIYTSTEAPPSFKIPLHNELSFVKNYPSHIYFFCETPSSIGGATILGDARKIYKSVDAKIRDKFTQAGLKYVSRYYHRSKLIESIKSLQKSHKKWIDVFETGEKAEVETKCHANEFSYCWHKNDWLEISQTRPAVIDHPITKDKIWFNQAQLYDFNPRFLGWGKYIGTKIVYCRSYTKLHDIFFSDGTKIPREELYHIHDILDQNTVSFPWKKGDMLVLDNILAMHGRAPFEGKRRVLAAMTR